MTKTITIHQAKTHLSRYLKLVAKGEPIYIGSYGQPEAMLVPITKTTIKFGLLKGKIKFSDDIIESDPEVVEIFYKSSKKTLK